MLGAGFCGYGLFSTSQTNTAYNPAMRVRLAHTAVVAITCLPVSCRFLQAQSYPSGFTITCPSLSEMKDELNGEEQQPSGPKIVVQEIAFSGAPDLPTSEVRDLVAAANKETLEASLDSVTDDVVERTRAAWQDRGYFKAVVHGKARVLSSALSTQRISVEVHVDRGLRYRLGEINFKNNTKIADLGLLRSVFPIQNGDVFSREKIAQGLEMLRRTYSESGYINFTAVPDTSFDNDARVISLLIDMDEGKQFHFGNIEIVGLDDAIRREVLKDAPIGQIYRPELLDQFLAKYTSVFKLRPDDPRLLAKRMDEQSGTVSIILYACPCPTC